MKREQKLKFKKTDFIVKELGSVGVDAGILMVGDPCYSIGLREDIDKTFEQKLYGKNWAEFFDKLDAANFQLQLPHSVGYCISTVNGNGFYNIYGLFDSDRTEQPKYLLVEL